mgnify:CR=1 FL=1
MRMMKQIAIALMAIFVLISPELQAQCAMCKAVAETSHNGGSSVADGLNYGIVYLMTIPYLLMGVVGFAVYRHHKGKPLV